MFEAIGRFRPADLDRHDRIYRRWIAAQRRAGKAAGRIAWIGSEPVGSGVVWLQPGQPRPAWPELEVPYLMSIFVEPGHRGAGIGAAVTEALVLWARARGFRRVVLHASPFGRRVYERLGFERSWEMRLGGSSIPGPEPERPYDEPAPRGPGRRTRTRRRRAPPDGGRAGPEWVGPS